MYAVLDELSKNPFCCLHSAGKKGRVRFMSPLMADWALHSLHKKKTIHNLGAKRPVSSQVSQVSRVSFRCPSKTTQYYILYINL